MPGTNLTRDEAADRARLLEATAYVVDLDLTVSDKVFASTTTLHFTCREPGAETFADLVDGDVRRISLNGRELDPLEVYAEHRIALTGLVEHNELVVEALLPFSHTGEGLHRFVDPVDDRVYTYTQFEVPDARRVYTTFEQPDLKSVFTFTVTAPAGWTVISNAATPEPEDLGEGRARWAFGRTERMSTYITAIVAGEYHAVHHVYEGPHGTIPLGHFCRQSVVAQLDVEELVEVTQQGFAFFEDAFGYPYPFGKYDQAYVPEYNMGAMENAGCVTLRDEYLPRSRQTHAFYEQRANTVLHEMAHMWFGDLVTMKWWDDLWLNESFAEWAAHHSSVKATRYTEAWTGFTNARKNWAYRQDQLPSTHPVVADNVDLEAVEVNFDGITYAKGASILKQLVAYVGEEEFLSGLRDYFAEHAFANTEYGDLVTALEAVSGRDLAAWSRAWLQTSGVNTLRPSFEVDADGTFTSFTVEQSHHPDFATLRPHRIGIGLYEVEGGRLVRRHHLETDVDGASTEIPKLIGQQQPALLLLNDGDLSYAKIRLDDRSLATLVASIDTLDDSLARALCWGAAWDMTRDAEMSATAFSALVLQGVATESDLTAVSALLRYAQTAVDVYSAPEHREALRARWDRGVRELALVAEPGSDHQLALVRALTAASHSDETLDLLVGWYDGSQTLEGLSLDPDLRWLLLYAAVRHGLAGEDEIAVEQERDGTISGRERAASARALIPTPEAKEAAWRTAVERDDTPNETQRQIAVHFQESGDEALLAPYVHRYLEAAATIWESKGVQRSRVVLQWMFPRTHATQAVLDRVDTWLADNRANPGAVRFVREGADDVRRALAAQAYDASVNG